MFPVVMLCGCALTPLRLRTAVHYPVHVLGKQLQLMWITLIEKNVSWAWEAASFRRKKMDGQHIWRPDLPIPSCVILGKVLELGAYLCTVGTVILTYLSPRAMIRTNHTDTYKTLYMPKENWTAFGQSMDQLPAFIFFLGHALKEEGWARGWIGVIFKI